jgi:hypothetical protein
MTSLIRRFLVVAAVLALASLSGFASSLGDCGNGGAGYTLNQLAGNTCTVGDFEFSNFGFQVAGNTLPNYYAQASDVQLLAYTYGSDTGLTFNINAGDIVGTGEDMALNIQYTVAPITSSMGINYVEADAYGPTNDDAAGAYSYAQKDLCLGTAFSGYNGDNSSTCPTGNTEDFVPNASPHYFSMTNSSPNGGPDGYGISATTTLGVSDFIQLYGGSSPGIGGGAEIDYMDNSFGEGPTGGVPEPTTLLLIGAGLLGLGVLRRKRV